MTPLQTLADTTQAAASTAYDSLWGQPDAPLQAASRLDQVMLAQDKLYVVLAVVLIIWLGLIFFLFRTDRRLARLERTLDESIPAKTE